ncbi:MAG: response regulator [Thermodesulfovibrionales bacterium]|nr:response regulator [Thermodesulfovibrionales bacterium]
MEATRILVVEDESLIARDITNSLALMGYQVTGTAATGADALDHVERTSPDIVLMDIVLSGEMDGIKTAQEIHDRYNIPVIYLTACSDDGVIERAKLTGPFGYIVKPFKEDELHLAIEMGLYKHQMEQELKLSREQFRSLLESAGAIPWEMDPKAGRFTYMGPQARAVLGFAKGELSDFESFIKRVPGKHSDRVREFYLRAYEHNESAEIEYPITANTGEVVWLRDTGTFTQSVSGVDCLRGFMRDITRRKRAEHQREEVISELQEALVKIRTLHGMLPICAWCKKIRDDKGYWKQVEFYVEEHSDAEFTHSMCPECKSTMEGELSDMKTSGDKEE